MNERTRQKKLRRIKRWITIGTIAAIAVVVSFGTLKLCEQFIAVPSGAPGIHGTAAADAGLPDVHGTARARVLGEKVVVSDPPQSSDNFPSISMPTGVPEPTTLLLLAPATLLVLRRTRRT